MGHEMTEPSYVALMMRRCEAHGFSPFHVKTQSMGYIYNRFVTVCQTSTPKKLD